MYLPGTKAEHDCNSGYSRAGPYERTCGSSGDWSGNIETTCNEGEHILYFIDNNNEHI